MWHRKDHQSVTVTTRDGYYILCKPSTYFVYRLWTDSNKLKLSTKPTHYIESNKLNRHHMSYEMCDHNLGTHRNNLLRSPAAFCISDIRSWMWNLSPISKDPRIFMRFGECRCNTQRINSTPAKTQNMKTTKKNNYNTFISIEEYIPRRKQRSGYRQTIPFSSNMSMYSCLQELQNWKPNHTPRREHDKENILGTPLKTSWDPVQTRTILTWIERPTGKPLIQRMNTSATPGTLNLSTSTACEAK